MREKHTLKLAVGLLNRKILPSLLKLALPLAAGLVQKGIGQLYFLAVLHLEPGMRQYFLDSFEGADPVAGTLGEQSFYERPHFFADCGRFGKFGLGVEYGLEDLLFFGCVEGRAAEE